MNLVVVGWPGSGKTLVSSTLAREVAANGDDVLAIHSGQTPIVTHTLGLTPDVEITPLPVDLLKRVGPVGKDPDLELAKSTQEIIDDYGVEAAPGLTLLRVATFDHLASDCTCSGHVTVRTVLSRVVQDRDEVTVIDDVVAIDQLPRDTIEAVDIVLVVVEPHNKSLEAGRRVTEYAENMGIPDVRMLANKVRGADQRSEIKAFCATNEIPLIGFIPSDDAVHHLSADDIPPRDTDHEDGAVAAIQTVATGLLVGSAPDERSRGP